MWTTGASRREDARRASGRPRGRRRCRRSGRRRPARPAAAVVAEHVAERCRGRAGASSSMLTSDELAPQTSAPSSSATRVSSAWAPEIATPSPMMIIGRLGAGQQRRPPRSTSGRVRDASASPASTSATIGSVVGRVEHVHRAGRRRPGPVGGVAAILIARRSTRSSDAGSTTRVAHFVTGLAIDDQVGRHLGVHRVVADAGLAGDHDQRRRRRAWPGTASRCRCRGRRRCGAGRPSVVCRARA